MSEHERRRLALEMAILIAEQLGASDQTVEDRTVAVLVAARAVDDYLLGRESKAEARSG